MIGLAKDSELDSEGKRMRKRTGELQRWFYSSSFYFEAVTENITTQKIGHFPSGAEMYV